MRSLRLFGALRRPAILGALLVSALLGVSAAPAMAHVSFGIGIGVPCCGYYGPSPYYYPPYYAPPAYYYAPPAYPVPAPAAAPAPVVQAAPASCSQGQWRQADGSVVSGTACQQPDGTWKLSY